MNINEPEPEVALPEPPAHLSAGALAEWIRITPLLLNLGLVTRLDLAALAAYCQCYGRWVEAEKNIVKHGELVKSPNGYPMLSPHMVIANRALEQVHKFATEFGLSPVARSRVSAVKDQMSRLEQEERDFSDFVDGGTPVH